MTVKGSVHPFLLRVLDWELNQLPAILGPARRQVNAKGLLPEVQAAEEGLEAKVGPLAHHLASLSSGRMFSITQVCEPKDRPAVKAMRRPSG